MKLKDLKRIIGATVDGKPYFEDEDEVVICLTDESKADFKILPISDGLAERSYQAGPAKVTLTLYVFTDARFFAKGL